MTIMKDKLSTNREIEEIIATRRGAPIAEGQDNNPVAPMRAVTPQPGHCTVCNRKFDSWLRIDRHHRLVRLNEAEIVLAGHIHSVCCVCEKLGRGALFADWDAAVEHLKGCWDALGSVADYDVKTIEEGRQ